MKNEMKFCTVFDHPAPVSPHGGKSMTDPQFMDECDINKVLKRFGATGELPRVAREGVSGDFSNIGDYQSCLDRIIRSKNEFAALPSDLRARFGNDPEAYVNFVLDPSNVEECVRLGLRVVEKHEDTAVDVLKRIEASVVTPKEDTPA